MSERGRAFRRAKADSKMWRRIKEDRNQHYTNLTCACYQPGKAMARFKEQPKVQQGCLCCCNPRRNGKGFERLTIQEHRATEMENL